MNSRTTILLIVLAATILGSIALIAWRQDRQESFLAPAKADEDPAAQIPSAPSPANIPSNSDEANEQRELIEELLSFLPDDTNDRKIVYAGSELLEVEGLYIDEDSETGSVTVIGLTRITFLDGRSVRAGGDDATMHFDPSSGAITVEADSITYQEARESK